MTDEKEKPEEIKIKKITKPTIVDADPEDKIKCNCGHSKKDHREGNHIGVGIHGYVYLIGKCQKCRCKMFDTEKKKGIIEKIKERAEKFKKAGRISSIKVI